MGYSNFYANVCRLLSSINSGICHRRPTVRLPMSKVGLELSQALRNLGIIEGYTVGQQYSRVKGFARLWDPAATQLTSSAEAAGFPAMYLTIHLNWDKHKPLYSRAQLAAAPGAAQLQAGDGSSSHVATPGFTPPMSLNSPTPEHVKIISKPSAQRWMGLQQLLRARAKAPPGIYLLSTHQGLMTDIDAEYRGIGGILLAHLGLPMGHVVQLRGLLRSKYMKEMEAAAGAQQPDAAGSGGADSGLQLQPAHVALSQWDGRRVAGEIVAGRLAAGSRGKEASAYLDYLDQIDQPRKQQSAAAAERLHELQLQELLRLRGIHAGSSSSSSSRGDRSSGGDSRLRRQGRRSSGPPGGGAAASGTDTWKPSNASGTDTWKPSNASQSSS